MTKHVDANLFGESPELVGEPDAHVAVDGLGELAISAALGGPENPDGDGTGSGAPADVHADRAAHHTYFRILRNSDV